MHRGIAAGPSAFQRSALGLAGGLLGCWAMDQFARAVHNARDDGREADGAAPGADRVGRGVQPPQAERRAERDATVRVGSIAYRAVTGSEPDEKSRRWLGSAAHYAFGASTGLLYGLLSPYAPVLRRGYGCVYGALVWAVADEGVIPALGLSRGPRELPRGVHLYALAGHFVYGAALDAVVRLGSANEPSSAPRGLPA